MTHACIIVVCFTVHTSVSTSHGNMERPLQNIVSKGIEETCPKTMFEVQMNFHAQNKNDFMLQSLY